MDTAAEGSITSRYLCPEDWNRVKQHLIGLGLEHLVGPIDALGVDDMEDFEFLYREDLMEAGATKEEAEAEAILGCTGAAGEGRSDPPPLARAGYHRPSRPATQGFQGPAVAARIVNADDRANRVHNAAPRIAGAAQVLPLASAHGSGAAQVLPLASAQGSGAAQALPLASAQGCSSCFAVGKCTRFRGSSGFALGKRTRFRWR